MATAEFYQSFNEIRCFRNDERLEYEPPLEGIRRSYFYRNEGKTKSVAVCCAKCGCLLVAERERRILSLPSNDWESLHFGCAETKAMSDEHIKRIRKASYNMMLFCALWLEVRDDACDDDDEDDQACNCYPQLPNKRNYPSYICSSVIFW